MSRSVTVPVLATSVTSTAMAIRTIVASGRVSAAMPGISPARRRGSAGAADRRRGSSSSPRSIFGARLRTRWPQYGHSVTYGLTSDEQFLQTTNRSGSLTRPRILPAAGPAD